jgi:hypothetical protein
MGFIHLEKGWVKWMSEGGTEIFSGKVVLKGWGYTFLVFKDRVHGTIKVGTMSPLFSAFCYH